MLFDEIFELVGIRKSMKGSDEVDFIIMKPTPPEMEKSISLRFFELEVRFRKCDFLRFPIDEYIGQFFIRCLRSMQSLFKFLFGAGRNRAVKALISVGQGASQTFPEYAKNEMAIGRLYDLVLKRAVRCIILIFPSDEFKGGGLRIIAVYLFNHSLKCIALRIHV